MSIEILKKPIRALNVMESLGIGGGQVMMFELSNGLNKYFGDQCKSFVAGTKKDASAVVFQPKLLETYGVKADRISHCDLERYCKKNAIDIVVHHRVSISSPVKKNLPKGTIYIVVSHTAASLGQIRNFFPYADYIVTVCKHLYKCTPKLASRFSMDRMAVILNGIENDFVKDLEPLKLRGTFKTGRCHRLVPTKFALDSLGSFEKWKPKLLGHVHYLMGSGNKALPMAAKGKDTVEYVGEVTDRDLKFRYIKSLDAYFYEILTNEGASIAVLESLACGVPVVCLKKGGIRELVKHSVNGFIEKDREAMLKKLQQLKNSPETIKKMKEETLKDFDERLHIRHCARKYMKLFSKAMERKKK